MQESKQEVTKVISLKNWRKINQIYSILLRTVLLDGDFFFPHFVHVCLSDEQGFLFLTLSMQGCISGGHILKYFFLFFP